MAFPVTGILDDFNRPDEGPPPSSDWTTVEEYGHEVVSNQCEAGSAGTDSNRSFWTKETLGPDCEAYYTIVDYAEYADSVHLRMTTTDTATYDGYQVYHSHSSDELRIYRIDDGGFTLLGSTETWTSANGDKIGGSCVGSAIKCYVDDGGTGWTEKMSRTDATYSSAGYIGIRTQDSPGNTPVLDDFGGGTISDQPVQMVASSDAVSGISGDIRRTIGLVISIPGTSTFSGKIIRTRYVTTGVSAEAAMVGAFVDLIQMVASSVAVSDVSGDIRRTIGLVISIPGISTFSGKIIRTRYVTTSVPAEATVVGTFAALIQIVASSAAVVTTAANVIRGRVMSATSDSVVTITGLLKARNFMKSVVAAVSSFAGRLGMTFDLKGSSGSRGTANAELGGGIVRISGSIQTFMARLRRKNR